MLVVPTAESLALSSRAVVVDVHCTTDMETDTPLKPGLSHPAGV